VGKGKIEMKLAMHVKISRQGITWVYAVKGQPITLGRAADSTIVLDDPQVSRHHARIEWRNSQPYLIDLGSANGTVVNGATVPADTPHPIQGGDRVQIGDFQLSPSLPQTAQGDPPARPFSDDKAAVLIAVEPSSATLSVSTTEGMQEYPLQGGTITLGRDPSNDIHIAQPIVSRRHARLERTEHGYLIADLDSANGLTWHDQRISKMLLADGDELWVSDEICLTYTITPAPLEKAAMRTSVQAAPPEPEPLEVEAAPINATLLGVETPVTGLRKIDLRQRGRLNIGRSPENDLQLDYPTISRHHARISRSGERYVIEDMGSSNGTFVNGELIEPGQPFPLHPGNTMRIGPIKFIFAPETVQLVDESRDLRLDALHLNQFVRKEVNLLQDISLAVQPREFVAVVGVSGAGKSTLLTALAGIRPASDGAVLVNGTNLYRQFDTFRTDLGFVPQDDIIHKELSAEKALDYAARLRLPGDTSTAERQRLVRDELQTLGLAERKDVPVGKLSGGQRKRVSIGVERLTRPGLFFLDEATSGLDPGTENQLMRLLRKLADEGQTILLITHATKNVMLCDQVVFLAAGGNLAYFGPPSQALEYFGVSDFDEIYEKLQDQRSPQEWAEQYRRSPQYQDYIVGRLRTEYGELLDVRSESASAQPGSVAPGSRAVTSKSKVKRPSSLRHFTVLTARYLDIIRSDRINLLLMLLIAPILGSMDLIAWPRDIFDPVTGDASRAMVMLFLAAIIPFLVGALSSVREIVKEKAIYQRERTVNLRIIPYLLSKVSVGLLFSLYHAAALLILKLVAVDFSHIGADGIALYFVMLVLAALSGVMWGLLISAIAPREEQAMLLVIVVVVVQMVFSGGILPLDQLGQAGEGIGYATSSKWAFEGLVNVTEVKRGDCDDPTLENCLLSGIQAYDTAAERRVVLDQLEDRYGEVLQGKVSTSIAVQLGLVAVMFIVLAVIQKRKDVI
jgi:ABC-type multidrug transport system ATPase subunit/pSer/pThr/pTyr-binding forkhead associated (FHA) protein